MMSTSRRGRSTPDLLFSLELEKKSDQPFHRQLGMQVRQAILDGRLLPGARLSSTRTLAKILHISRNSVVVAYEELCAEGYLTGTHGSGTFVASDFPPLPRPIQSKMRHAPRWLSHPLPFIEGEEASQPGMLAFRLGATTTTSLSPRLWRSIWRDVAKQPLPNDYGPPEGEGMLRSAIARYLERARGVVCRAENMVITSGTVQALDLLARATLSAGDLVGIEEPGYPLARQVFQARQARLIPIAVDHDELQVQTLPHGPSAPLLVYVTPSHQYPLASRLSIARRLALLEWARTHDSLIVEDDYDSEFRFDAPPLPALAGVDTSGQVAYIGSFSKILSPALRVGYLVASAELCERVTHYKLLTDYHTSWPVQRALTVLLTEGHLERHIQRMRHHYAEKRALLSSVLAPLAPKAQLLGLEAGLHAYLELSPRFKTKALWRGIAVRDMEGWREEEDALIRLYWPESSQEELMRHMPLRSRKSIAKRASDLGVPRDVRFGRKKVNIYDRAMTYADLEAAMQYAEGEDKAYICEIVNEMAAKTKRGEVTVYWPLPVDVVGFCAITGDGEGQSMRQSKA